MHESWAIYENVCICVCMFILVTGAHKKIYTKLHSKQNIFTQIWDIKNCLFMYLYVHMKVGMYVNKCISI